MKSVVHAQPSATIGHSDGRRRKFSSGRFSFPFATSLTAVSGAYVVGDSRHGMLAFFILLSASFLALLQIVHSRTRPRIPQTWLPVGLVATIAPLSSLWSVLPNKTFRSGILLLLIAVCGLLIGQTTSLEDQIRTVAWLGLFWATTALLLYGLDVSGSVDSDSRGLALRGLFVSKNSLGRAIAIGMIGQALTSWSSKRWSMWALAMAPMAAAIYLSESKSSLLLILVLAVTAVSVRFGPRTLRRILPLMAGVIYLSGAVLTPLASAFASHVGRDPTLTGRVPLWAIVEEFTARRPLLGYGFDAFWTGSNGASISNVLGWTVAHAHNGLLEMRLDLGWVGVVAAAAMFFSVSRSPRPEIKNPSSNWPWLLALAVAISDLAEATSTTGLAILLMSAATCAKLSEGRK